MCFYYCDFLLARIVKFDFPHRSISFSDLAWHSTKDKQSSRLIERISVNALRRSSDIAWSLPELFTRIFLISQDAEVALACFNVVNQAGT
jgi:hypothetical protein